MFRNKIVITIVAIGIFGLLLAFGLSNWKTVYEIYAADQNLGVARDGLYIQDEYAKLQDLVRNEHPELNHVSSQELKLVKTKGWFPEDDTEQILSRLPSLLDPNVEASEILVNGEKVAVVANEEQAAKSIALLKAPFEMNDGSGPELVEDVTFQPVHASPESVMTAEQAAEIMAQTKDSALAYEVVEGDTIWDIAQETNVPFEQLLLMNPDFGDSLKAGQKVILSPEKRLVNIKTLETKVEEVSIPYRTIVQTGKGQEQSGKDGMKEVTNQITAINGMQVSQNKLEEKILQEPIDQIKVKKPRVQAASIGSAGSGNSGNSEFIWPTDGGIITSGYGYRDGEFHNGYDIAGAKSLQIKASASGKVTYSGWQNGYGNLIILSHSNGLTTYYAHNKKNQVSVGDEVKQGQEIATMGSTGDSTGVHLHYEIRSKEQAMDPGPYLK